MRPTLYQINLSPTLGGAEVYTHFFARVLQDAGWRNVLVTRPGADFWSEFEFDSIDVLPLADSAIPGWAAALPRDSMLVVHSSMPADGLHACREAHFMIGLAHQAIYSDAVPAYYRRAHLLLAVSRHVIATLARAGIHDVHPEPLYGLADFSRHVAGAVPPRIVRGELFDVDRRKFRDRVVAGGTRLAATLRGSGVFEKRPGITLGIVSRIAPLKQFPTLFGIIAPALAARADVNLEIFGSGVGYAPLRALRNALAPLGGRARFWGYQSDVRSLYDNMDYLLTGLPEREALGLNVIEAQLCGVPVIAPRGAPFTETVVDGETGFLYTDPRVDAGADFARILASLSASRSPIDPQRAAAHLRRFSMKEFSARADAALVAAWAQARVRGPVQ